MTTSQKYLQVINFLINLDHWSIDHSLLSDSNDLTTQVSASDQVSDDFDHPGYSAGGQVQANQSKTPLPLGVGDVQFS